MITLIEPSIDILPAFNRINYQITSTNANLDGFKFVVQVYNTADELITQAFYDAPANPADEVDFDISKFVNVNFNYSKGVYEVASSSSSQNIIKGFYLECYEFFEVDGVPAIINASLVTSATKFALAASFPLLELDNWYADVNLYNGISNVSYEPLTEWTSIKVRQTDSQVLGFINTGLLVNIELQIIYENGTTGEAFITPAVVSSPNITYIQISPITYASGGQNVASIAVFVNWNNGSARRAKVADIFTQNCGQYDPMRLAYLNKFGVYDFFNFDLVSKTSFDVERKSYERNYTGSIYESNGVVVKNITPVYYTKETQKWKIISDYLNNEQAETLRELYSSPLVYMNLVNDNYINFSWIPAKPTATSYEVKKTSIDKVFNIELELEFRLINNRQVI